jgi:phospholipase A1
VKKLFPLLLGLFPAFATASPEAYQKCLTDGMANALEHTTVGEIRASCATRANVKDEASAEEKLLAEPTVASRRLSAELTTQDNKFVITPFLPNYILVGAHNLSGISEDAWEQATGRDQDFENTEIQFQISLKFPLVKSLFGNNGDLYAAYTNRSFWQFYDSEDSSPFRDSNHQPETWLRFYSGYKLFGMENLMNDIGLVHQSNGQSGVLSRSWNRAYLRFTFAGDNLAFAIQPWYRFKEDAGSDDNPDIEDYLGHFELTGAYKWDRHQFDLMARNNLDTEDNHGALQLGWSFPLYGHLRGYVHWFNGYGENLLDYNRRSNTIGVGVKLSDWL